MSLTGLTNLQPLHIKTVGIGTFDNTVSIGGTLTYEDVTNVDAIGIITARSGIRIGATGANTLIQGTATGIGIGSSPDRLFHLTHDNTPYIRTTLNDTTVSANDVFGAWEYESIDDSAGSAGVIGKIDCIASAVFDGTSANGSVIRFHTSGTNPISLTERLRITSDGKIGINETSPNTVLHVKHHNNDTADITIEGGGGGNAGIQFIPGGQTNSYFAYVDTNRNFRIQDHTSEKLRIVAGGKILIGNGTTYTPQGMLHIVGDDNSNGPELYLMVPNNNVTDNIGALVFGNNVDKSVVKIQGVTHTANNTGDLTFHTSTTGTMSEKLRITNAGNVIIGSGTPDGKLHIDGIGSGDIIAGYTSGSPTFTYRNGGGSWMHAGKHPTANEFIISEGATTTAVEMLRIQGGGGTNDSKFKFPSVESPSAHGESTAHIEIGGRHIWKRITSTNHVTTSTSTNHFYLAFWRSESGTKRTCYYRGVVVNVVASGNYDWSGHGYVTHSSQTILSFGGTTTGVHNTTYNQGFNQIHNTGGGTNMQLHNVAYSYDGTYLYANFRFKTNLSGTGFKPHYNVEVIAPDQILYTCEAF